MHLQLRVRKCIHASFMENQKKKCANLTILNCFIFRNNNNFVIIQYPISN